MNKKSVKKRGDLTKLSIEYNILSPWTAYLAIEKREDSEISAITTNIQDLINVSNIDDLSYIEWDIDELPLDISNKFHTETNEIDANLNDHISSEGSLTISHSTVTQQSRRYKDFFNLQPKLEIYHAQPLAKRILPVLKDDIAEYVMASKQICDIVRDPIRKLSVDAVCCVDKIMPELEIRKIEKLEKVKKKLEVELEEIKPELQPIETLVEIDIVLPKILKCHKYSLCTFTLTQQSYWYQPIYQCYDCNLTRPAGVCATCLNLCHKGHRVSEIPIYTKCFCDCGADPQRYKCCGLKTHKSISDIYSHLLSTQQEDGSFDLFDICPHLQISADDCIEEIVKIGARSLGQILYDVVLSIIGSALVSAFLNKAEDHNRVQWAIAVGRAERFIITETKKYNNLTFSLGIANWRELALNILTHLCPEFVV